MVALMKQSTIYFAVLVTIIVVGAGTSLALAFTGHDELSGDALKSFSTGAFLWAILKSSQEES